MKTFVKFYCKPGQLKVRNAGSLGLTQFRILVYRRARSGIVARFRQEAVECSTWLPAYRSRFIQFIIFRLVVLLDLIIDMFDFLAVHLVDAVIHIQVWISHISVSVL